MIDDAVGMKYNKQQVVDREEAVKGRWKGEAVFREVRGRKKSKGKREKV